MCVSAISNSIYPLGNSCVGAALSNSAPIGACFRRRRQAAVCFRVFRLVPRTLSRREAYRRSMVRRFTRVELVRRTLPSLRTCAAEGRSFWARPKPRLSRFATLPPRAIHTTWNIHRAEVRVDRRLPWPPAWCPSRWEPRPQVQRYVQPPTAALPGSRPPTGFFRSKVSFPMPKASTRLGSLLIHLRTCSCFGRPWAVPPQGKRILPLAHQSRCWKWSLKWPLPSSRRYQYFAKPEFRSVR